MVLTLRISVLQQSTALEAAPVEEHQGHQLGGATRGRRRREAGTSCDSAGSQEFSHAHHLAPSKAKNELEKRQMEKERRTNEQAESFLNVQNQQLRGAMTRANQALRAEKQRQSRTQHL
ncbi:hypothetical protein NDU88_007353 [Pleurodeles waltl]|uniref:Uncharacterized protein n=1 Tax=Pleurodeles waltl TaxID=8319 RepID=A0AAV7RUV2_PLEWA|nr:hypothetical protein NDU88_007353 [Pleurodeles waltl]